MTEVGSLKSGIGRQNRLQSSDTRYPTDNKQLPTSNLQHPTHNAQLLGITMIEVSGQTVAWHEGMTITDLLDEIKDSHPYAVVRVDNKYVSRPNFDKTTIPDDAKVFLIPMVVGG